MKSYINISRIFFIFLCKIVFNINHLYKLCSRNIYRRFIFINKQFLILLKYIICFKIFEHNLTKFISFYPEYLIHKYRHQVLQYRIEKYALLFTNST